MKILIDLLFFKNADISIGFTRVALGLVANIQRLDSYKTLVLLADTSSCDYLRATFSNCTIIALDTRGYLSCFFPNRMINKISQIIRKEKINLYFSPFISARTIVTPQVPAVGILHDVQKFKLNSGNFIYKSIYHCLMIRVLSKFDRIVTISNSERKHIQSTIPVLKNKLLVIHNGINITDGFKKMTEIPKNARYILDINTLFEYKNALVLVKAFELIKNEFSHLLILKGKKTKYWEEVLYPFILSHNLQSRVILIDRILNDREVAYLYKHADAFVSPSLMEGFGLTPVEAAIYGTPVICSDIDTLKEATMGLVNYFNPKDYRQLANLLRNVLKSKDSSKLQYISNTLAAEYSVIEQTKKYLKIFDEYENNDCNTCF